MRNGTKASVNEKRKIKQADETKLGSEAKKLKISKMLARNKHI